MLLARDVSPACSRIEAIGALIPICVMAYVLSLARHRCTRPHHSALALARWGNHLHERDTPIGGGSEEVRGRPTVWRRRLSPASPLIFHSIPSITYLQERGRAFKGHIMSLKYVSFCKNIAGNIYEFQEPLTLFSWHHWHQSSGGFKILVETWKLE